MKQSSEDQSWSDSWELCLELYAQLDGQLGHLHWEVLYYQLHRNTSCLGRSFEHSKRFRSTCWNYWCKALYVYIWVRVWCPTGEMILKHTDNLSKTMQNPQLSASECQTLAELTWRAVEGLRNDDAFNLFWSKQRYYKVSLKLVTQSYQGNKELQHVTTWVKVIMHQFQKTSSGHSILNV